MEEWGCVLLDSKVRLRSLLLEGLAVGSKLVSPSLKDAHQA